MRKIELYDSKDAKLQVTNSEDYKIGLEESIKKWDSIEHAFKIIKSEIMNSCGCCHVKMNKSVMLSVNTEVCILNKECGMCLIGIAVEDKLPKSSYGEVIKSLNKTIDKVSKFNMILFKKLQDEKK